MTHWHLPFDWLEGGSEALAIFPIKSAYSLHQIFSLFERNVSLLNGITHGSSQINKVFFKLVALIDEIQYQPPFYWRDNFQSQTLKIIFLGVGQKKMSAWDDLKSSCHGYFPGGMGYYISCQKTSKNKIWL